MKIKKLVVIAIVAILTIASVLSLTACATADGSRIDKRYLTVATNAAFPPFESVDDNGNYIGIDMEIAQEIANYLGVKLKIKDMEFDSVIASIPAKSADIGMAGLTISEERKKSVAFCDPYYKASQVVIARTGDAALAAATDAEISTILAGKKIGFQNGTVGEYYVKGDADWGFDGIANAIPSGFTNGAAAVVALQNSQVDYVVIDLAPAENLVKANAGIAVNTAVKLTDEDYAFCVRLDNTVLLEQVNAAMKTLKENGKFDEIVNKYFAA